MFEPDVYHFFFFNPTYSVFLMFSNVYLSSERLLFCKDFSWFVVPLRFCFLLFLSIIKLSMCSVVSIQNSLKMPLPSSMLSSVSVDFKDSQTTDRTWFATLWWWETDIHSVETVLWILVFSWASNMYDTLLRGWIATSKPNSLQSNLLPVNFAVLMVNSWYTYHSVPLEPLWF